MGEANRRGTYKERKALAIARKKMADENKAAKVVIARPNSRGKSRVPTALMAGLIGAALIPQPEPTEKDDA